MCSNLTYVNEIENTKYQAIWINFYVLFVLLRPQLCEDYTAQNIQIGLDIWSFSTDIF